MPRAEGQKGDEVRERIAQGHEVSFGGDENALKLWYWSYDWAGDTKKY